MAPHGCYAGGFRMSRAGLTDPKRPTGVFLLAGTSGVGKTKTALALAELLFGDESSLTVINMSEFKEEHEVSLLMGYVRYVLPRHKAANWGGMGPRESPRGRGPMASSSSRRLSFWTGSPISCRHRGSTGIGITEYSRPITSSGGPSRRWLTSFKGCRSPVAAWCLRRLHRSSPRNGSYIRSEIRISFRGNPKAKLSRVNVHPVPNRR